MEVHVIHKSQADASSDTIETVSVRDEAIVPQRIKPLTILCAAALHDIQQLDHSNDHDTGIHHMSTSIALDRSNHDVRLYIETSSSIASNGMSLRSSEVPSLASSAHFTLVNGFGKLRRPASPTKRGCCCECSPLTGLVLAMTLLLALIVSSLVLFTEYPHMGAIVQ